MSRQARAAFSRSAAVLSGPSCSAADRDAPTSTEPSAFWWIPRAWAASAPRDGQVAGRQPLERDRRGPAAGRARARTPASWIGVAQERRARARAAPASRAPAAPARRRPSACTSRRDHAPAATRIDPAAIWPASVTTARAPIRFTSTWVRMSAPAAAAAAAAHAASAPGSVRRPSSIRRPPAIPARERRLGRGDAGGVEQGAGDRRVLERGQLARVRGQEQRPDRRVVEAEVAAVLVGQARVGGDALAPERHELGVVGRQHEALAAAGRPGGERAALEQGHLGPRLGQVPGRRGPDDAAPDHDHVRHARSLQSRRDSRR